MEHLFPEIFFHYNDVVMNAMVSQIAGVSIICSTVGLGADQRKHQSSASLTLFEGNSPVTDELHAQNASNAENVSIWWRHHSNTAIWFYDAQYILGKFESHITINVISSTPYWVTGPECIQFVCGKMEKFSELKMASKISCNHWLRLGFGPWWWWN